MKRCLVWLVGLVSVSGLAFGVQPCMQPLDTVYYLDGYGEITMEGTGPHFVGMYLGWDIFRAMAAARQADGAISGFYLLDGFGGVHLTGPELVTGNAFYFGWDIARDIEAVRVGQTWGYYILDGYGGVHASQIGGVDMIPTFPFPDYWGWDIGRDLEVMLDTQGNVAGYYILDGYGGIFPLGNVKIPGSYRPYFGWDIARDIEVNPTTNGMYLVDGYGGIHLLGAAHLAFQPLTPYFFGEDVIVDAELSANQSGAVDGIMLLDAYGVLYAGGEPANAGFYGPIFASPLAKDMETSLWVTGPVTGPVVVN